MQLLLQISLLCLTATAFDTANVPIATLSGISFQNEPIIGGGINFLSMAGGSRLMVQGTNMGNMPNMNSVLLNSQSSPGISLISPPLSQDDEFCSNTALGILSYQIPPVWEIFPGKTWNDFNGQNAPSGWNPAIQFNLNIMNNDAGNQLQCATSTNCLISYSRDYTANLMYTTPSEVYQGQWLQFHINAKNSSNGIALPTTMDLTNDIRLGGFFQNTENIDQPYRLLPFQKDTIMVKVTAQPPNPENNQEPAVMFRNGLAVNLNSLGQCNFAGDTCWQVRTHPSITSISETTGFMQGGQTIEISGFGFNGTNAAVTIDGVACAISQRTSTTITCVTGQAVSPSVTNQIQPGSPGIQRGLFKKPDGTTPNYQNLDDASLLINNTLYTSFEGLHSLPYDFFGQKLSGWFTAPATARYRFYMSCDDQCQLKLDSVNPYNVNAFLQPNPTLIAFQYTAIYWRNYWYNENSTQISQWIDLTAGSSYYIEGKHIEQTGGDHISVSVEIEQPNVDQHPQAMPQVQKLQVLHQQNTYEQWSYVVTNPDNAGYLLNFLNPTTTPASVYQTQQIRANALFWEVENAINEYTNKFFGSNVSVRRTGFDASGAITYDSRSVKMYQYSITLLKLINGYSCNSVSFTKKGTNADIKATPPKSGVMSSTPLSGNFTVSCTDSAGIKWTTPDMPFNTQWQWIQNTITNSIPFMADLIEVKQDYLFTYPENGISFNIIFSGVTGQQALCQIDSSTTNPLSGNSISITSRNVASFGQSLFFEPLPLEFMSTPVMTPQVLVTINGTNAVCPDFSCGYSYIPTIGSILSQVIEGTLLTLSSQEVYTVTSVTLGGVQCINIFQTDLKITCNLADFPMAGSWVAQVQTDFGVIPSSADPITVPLTVVSATPNQNLNFKGGNVLTITGQNFGTDPTRVTTTFSDGSSCILSTLTSTSLTCIVNGFNIISEGPQTIILNVNGVVDQSQQVTQIQTLPQPISVIPSSASPVLKSNLNIQLGSTYPVTLDAADFSVVLLQDNNATFSKDLYIMSVNDTEKSIMVKFPGALSGSYHIQVSSIQFGRMLNDNLALTVGSNVTSITPSSGSIYGGTVLTITGVNFSNEPLDNPVKIGNLATTSKYCMVMTSSTTKITCRVVPIDDAQENFDQLLLVFLKTSEEAECVSADPCTFSFITPTATLSDISSAFDPISQTTQITVGGTGLSSLADLWIDGFQQTLVQSSDTASVFTLTSIVSQSSTVVQYYNSEGTASNNQVIQSVIVTPTLISINPQVGSAAGTVITVRGSGFASQNSELGLWRDGMNICSSIQYQDSNTFFCSTVAAIMLSSEVQLLNGNVKTSAAETTLTQFSQAADVSYTSATLSNNTITFVGSNFPTTGIVMGSYASVNATSGTSDGTNVVLTWSNGIPTSKNGVTPSLFFQNADNSGMFANGPASALVISNPLNISTSSTGLSCSFAGGCQYTITANGLLSSLQIQGNSIDICGNQCTLSQSLSDSTQATCILPSFSTQYSVPTFGLQQSDVVNGTLFPNDPKLYDSKLLFDHIDTSRTTCNFGMSFAPNHQVILDEAKVFLNKVYDKTPFVNNLDFQGSNDNFVTFTTIKTFGVNIHEGWNYLSFRDNDTKPSFNAYRFWGKKPGSCRVGEFRLTGVDVIADNNPTYSCTPTVIVDGVQTEVSPVTFDGSLTSELLSISPRFGPVTGGTTVTLTGVNFNQAVGTNVMFDNRVCAVQSMTSATIICITDKKPYVPDEPLLTINQPGAGFVSTNGLVFRYVSLYSSPITWGGDIPPLGGESISIPKGQHLLIDVDSPPVLNAVVVEGSLIFAPNADPNHVSTFDANYIMVFGGYMEVGTEDFPYTSKLIITMHSNKNSPYLPIYGNKVIGVRFGQLEMHGVARPITWTTMNATAEKGDTSIVLNEVVDWQVGEKIVIATTSHDYMQSEVRIIASISNGNQITFEKPLKNRHFSHIETYGGIDMPMLCEVALLSRNVIYRGDPETSSKNQYGAHIMIHSPGDESSIGRIEYIELTDVGQAFKLGRYPLHFHMIGTVMNSYIKGCAIHQTYNRAVTMHGIHYLRITENVAFDTMGQTYFVEDAVETNNYLYHNIAIQCKPSFSLLNVDWEPSGFWITHPNNIFVKNAVAGSANHGFWFDMQEHSVGPSYSPNICPIGETLGEFRDNTAHSVGSYGLRIWHALLPRENPCAPMKYNSANLADPYKGNRPVLALFENFVGWKSGRNCAISERTGYVHFSNLKCADNILAGIEYSLTDEIADGYAKIIGGLVVGNTGLNNELNYRYNKAVIGVITPRSEGFRLEGTSFFNFNFAGSAALQDCSHCWHDQATDSGARTVRTSGLIFDDATVPKRILYELPLAGIWLDLDGTLTGLGPNTWAIPFKPHNNQPECQVNMDVYTGIICNSDVQVRRVTIYNYAPRSLYLQPLRVGRWDDDLVTSLQADNTTLQNYLNDQTGVNFSNVQYKRKQDPRDAWTYPYVTGHKYRMSFGDSLDWSAIRIEQSNQWNTTDLDTAFVFNHTEVRQAINVRTLSNKLIANNSYTINKAAGNLSSGDNLVQNDTAIRLFTINLNGKDTTGDRMQLNLKAIICVSDCVKTVIDVPVNDTQIYWSNVASWPSGKLPVDGDTVEILPSWNMILDLEQTPILALLNINGRLTFQNNPENGKNINLRANNIVIQAGSLIIGNVTNPFNSSYIAQITLFGKTNDVTAKISSLIAGGNKVIAVSGLIQMYGAPRSRWSRLTATAFMGNQTIYVDPSLDWKAGDQLYLSPTALQENQADYVTILSYSNVTGLVQLTSPLNFYHYGEAGSTADKYNGVDIRGEVILLTRNIKIVGSNEEAWGAQVVVTDGLQDDGSFRYGQLVIDSVQLYNCSQRDNSNAAIRFESVYTKQQSVSNSVAHNGWGWGLSVLSSANVVVTNTTFVGFKQLGVVVQQSLNITLDGMFTGDVQPRQITGGLNGQIDYNGCVSVCSYRQKKQGNNQCTNISVVNSISAGCTYAGFVIQGHDCGDKQQTIFRNNVAHSIAGGGANIHQDDSKPQHVTDCYEGSYFAAYKTQQGGVELIMGVRKIRHSQMTFIDCQLGINVNTGREFPDNRVEMNNITIFGESEAEDCPKNHQCMCNDKNAFRFMSGLQGEKDYHILISSPLPMWKMMSYGAFNATTLFTNFKFVNFATEKTRCGASQRIFVRNPGSSDMVPKQTFQNTQFVNVANPAMAWFEAPSRSWANIDDCGDFPCTAPNNIVLDFKGTTYSGVNMPDLQFDSFQIVANTPNVTSTFGECNIVSDWNAYACLNPLVGVLVFESLDPDTNDRNVAPIYISQDGGAFYNKLNSMMDHTWDGVYTGQKHLQRFESMLEVQGNYSIAMSGTPFKNARYYISPNQNQLSGGIQLTIQYWNAGVYQVSANGAQVQTTPWDKNLGTYQTLSFQKGCGENRFVGVKNFLQFYLTPGCVINIAPVDAIIGNVRLDFTMAEFYSKAGGVVSFADRVAFALGIHASQIKIVSVYTGSVVIDYQIVAQTTDPDSVTTLNNLNLAMNKLISDPNSSIVFGAPILGASTNGAPISIKPQSAAAGKSGNQSNQAGAGKSQAKGSVFNGAAGAQKATPTVKPIIDNVTVYVQRPSIVTTATSTDSSQASVVVEDSVKYIIVGVVILFILIIGAGVLTYFLMKKNRENSPIEKINMAPVFMQINGKTRNSIVGVSEAELQSQFHPQDANDLDIYGSVKKSKFNQDEVLNVTSHLQDEFSSFNSNIKLKNDSDQIEKGFKSTSIQNKVLINE